MFPLNLSVIYILNISAYQNVSQSYVELADHIKKKLTCVNVGDTHKRCVRWKILLVLLSIIWRYHQDRGSNYVPYENEPQFKGTDFPVLPRDVVKF